MHSAERRRGNQSFEIEAKRRWFERDQAVMAYVAILGAYPHSDSADDVLDQFGIDLKRRGFKFGPRLEEFPVEGMGDVIMTPRGYVLDKKRRKVLTPHGAKPILFPKECKLLYELMCRPGATLTYQTILARVWGKDNLDEIREDQKIWIRACVLTLRRKLGDIISKDEYGRFNGQIIKSEFDVGYSFTDKVIE